MAGFRLLLALVLATSALAFEVSPPATITTTPNYHGDVAMATNGSGALVVWAEGRLGIPHEQTNLSVTAVRGALLDAEGRPTAEHDFPIASSSMCLGVASNGREYVVASAEFDRNGQWAGDLTLSVVTPEGRVRARSAVRGQFSSLTAVRDDYYIVVLRDDTLFLVVLDSDARVLQPGVAIGKRGDYASIFGTSDGRLFMVATLHFGFTTGRFVSTSDLAQGKLVFLTNAPLAATCPATAMLETPQGFVLVWHSEGLQTALLDVDGAIIENTRDAYHLDKNASYFRDAVLLPTTGGFLAVESDGVRYRPYFTQPSPPDHGLATRRLDANRNAVDEQFELFDAATTHVAATPARGGGGWFAHDHYASHELRVRRVTPSGSIGSEVNVARSAPTQTEAWTKRCGDVSIVAWFESLGHANFRLLYRRFDSALRPIDPPNVVAGTTSWRPFLACGPSSALLTWEENSQVRGVLFPNVSGSPRAMAMGTSYLGTAAMTSDGTGYVVVRTSAMDRWSESGELLQSLPHVAPPFGYPAIEWNGSEFLLAGEVARRGTYPAIGVRRLDRNFNRLGADIVVRGDTERWWAHLGIAASDDMWLVAWIEHETETYRYEPRSMRISASGTPLDSDGGVASGPRSRSGSLAVAWNGRAFELLTSHAVTRRTVDGTVKTFPLLDDDAWLLAIEAEGETPLLVYWRKDPVHEVRRLFADRVARTWSMPRERRPPHPSG